MVKWYVCKKCGNTIDEFDSQYLQSADICYDCHIWQQGYDEGFKDGYDKAVKETPLYNNETF